MGLGEAAALGAAMLFSLNSVFLRWGGRKVDLFWLNAFRCLIAAVLMTALLLALRGPQGLLGLPPTAALWLAVTTLIMVAVGDSLFYVSCQYIGVARASPIANSYPLVSVLLAVLLLGEPASWRLVAATVLVLLGAFLVARPSGAQSARPAAEATAARTGLTLSILACLAWGAGAISDRLAMQVPDVDLLGAGAFRLLCGTVFLFVLARTRPYKIRWGSLPSGFLLTLFAAAVVCGVCTPLLWLFSVREVGAARASLLSATGPLWGLLFSSVFLRESITRSTIAGALLTILGVWAVL
jgi:drug/metabolite transporter (DMT)-like permease